jgi:hypothetical protein
MRARIANNDKEEPKSGWMKIRKEGRRTKRIGRKREEKEKKNFFFPARVQARKRIVVTLANSAG